MTYRIPMPGSDATLDIVEPNSTSVQRALRRNGLAAYEPSTLTTLLALSEQFGDELVFFDVGANMGLYALLCAQRFRPKAVHAFEPTPSTVRVMRRAVRANRSIVQVFDCALGESDGSADLHLSATSDSSNSLVAGFKRSIGTVRVPVRTLDGHVATTSTVPNLIKIDVETHEPAVLAGAAQTITAHRPFIVVEVLFRRGRDHGKEITDAMAPYGYTYYRLDDTPTWLPELRITGTRKSFQRDWLLAPRALDADFEARWNGWSRSLSECGPERNSRVPIHQSAVAAFRRGGAAEVLASARRFAAAKRRERGRTPS